MGDWYNLYELQQLHPNGEKVFPIYHMKDITETFYKNPIHTGIVNPQKIIEKYKIKDSNIIKKLDLHYFYYNL